MKKSWNWRKKTYTAQKVRMKIFTETSYQTLCKWENDGMTSSKWWKEKAVNIILYIKLLVKLEENEKQKLRGNWFLTDLHYKKC